MNTSRHFSGVGFSLLFLIFPVCVFTICVFHETNEVLFNICEWSSWENWNCTSCCRKATIVRNRGICCDQHEKIEDCLSNCNATELDGKNFANCSTVCPTEAKQAGQTTQLSIPTTPPSILTAQPSILTTLPSNPATRPSISTTLPSYPATQPSISTTLPSYPATQPSISTTLPSYPATQPSISTTLPSYPATQPSISTTLPSNPATQPFISTTQLPYSKAQPFTHKRRPLNENKNYADALFANLTCYHTGDRKECSFSRWTLWSQPVTGMSVCTLLQLLVVLIVLLALYSISITVYFVYVKKSKEVFPSCRWPTFVKRIRTTE